MATFVERLQQAARLAGTGDTQADIARDLGLKRQTVNRWFALGGEPDVDLTFHIANRYGVDPKWLKTGDGKMTAEPANDDLKPEERELVRNYRGATRQVREVISAMARAARKVAVVVVAASIPPLLSPQKAEATFNITAASQLSFAKYLKGIHIAALAFLTKICSDVVKSLQAAKSYSAA